MTNTRVTDLEILEKRYPIRHGSGGEGLHPGGDGAIRVFEARATMTFSLSSERRVHRPYGMAGGRAGQERTQPGAAQAGGWARPLGECWREGDYPAEMWRAAVCAHAWRWRVGGASCGEWG